MARDDRATQHHHTFFSFGWPYQVWCFGLLKQRFRKSVVTTLEDLCICVEESADVNIAQLVGTHDGHNIVRTYDWANFLANYFKKLQGIKSYHHFFLCKENPGVVHVKKLNDQPSQPFRILTSEVFPTATEMPLPVEPKGFSLEREWYLYDQIREFCEEGKQDLLCPLPSRPRQRSIGIPPPPNPDQSLSPVPKRQRRCGACGQVGHTITNCTK